MFKKKRGNIIACIDCKFCYSKENDWYCLKGRHDQQIVDVVHGKTKMMGFESTCVVMRGNQLLGRCGMKGKLFESKEV